jgi:hypothetical protein
MATVGMSVPGASDIGLGGPAALETDEERRKRLLAQQQSRLLPNSPPGASSLMTGFSAALPVK